MIRRANTQSPTGIYLPLIINQNVDSPRSADLGNPFICCGFGAVRDCYEVYAGVFIR
jgi:hypothetical protein